MRASRLLIAVAAMIGATGAAEAQRTGPIRSKLANGQYCLDVPRGDFREGVMVQMYRCQGSPNQRFTWTKNGQITIGKLCLGGANEERAPVGLVRCANNANQRWRNDACYPAQRCINPPEQGTQIIGINNMCLDVPNSNLGEGVGVIVYRCQRSDNQRWFTY